MLPASTLFGIKSKTSSSEKKQADKQKSSAAAKAATGRALTGAACGCPEGAKRIQTKRGSRCQRNGKFVKTACVTGG